MKKMNNKYKYSILTYIVGDYEIVHEIENPKTDVEYILVTDNPNLSSNTWTIKLVNNPHPEDPFYLCYQIRFHPFDYISSDIVIRIDGSMSVVGNTDILIDTFNENNYDACVMIHPGRNNMLDEYQTWCDTRKYNPQQANKILAFMANVYNYDAKFYKGLYQFNFMIQRNNNMNNNWNNLTFITLLYLKEENKIIERIDQTVGSMILNKYFSNNSNIMPVSEKICNGSFFNWYAHGSNKLMDAGNSTIQPFLFNKPVITLF